jgi:RNA polymerase sigma-70 factor, ECF subfamily
MSVAVGDGDREPDRTPAFDDDEFAELVERHRRELRWHCHRMLRSSDEADDAVQETFLRAWRARASFAGRSTLRSWLYRIATNVCLDEIDRVRRRGAPRRRAGWVAEGSVQRAVDVAAPSHEQPESLLLAKESLELACSSAITLLTPRQRAVLILHDVLGWSAPDAAATLDTSVASVNSALRRARARIEAAHRSSAETGPARTSTSAGARELLARYVEALGHPNPAAAVELVQADVTLAA